MADPGSPLNWGATAFLPKLSCQEAAPELFPPEGRCQLEQETSEGSKWDVGIFAALKERPFPALPLPAAPRPAGVCGGWWRAAPGVPKGRWRAAGWRAEREAEEVAGGRGMLGGRLLWFSHRRGKPWDSAPGWAGEAPAPVPDLAPRCLAGQGAPVPCGDTAQEGWGWGPQPCAELGSSGRRF